MFSRLSTTEGLTRLFALVATVAAMLLPATANAAVYITGSWSLQSTHLGFQTTESDYGSASVDIDLGHYIRLGYTYGVEFQNATGYKDPSATDSNDTNASGYCTQTCGQTSNKTKVIQNSVGLTIILYEGQVLMPFLLGGVTKKDMTIDMIDYDTKGNLVHTVETLPGQIVPYGGGGIGIRLNREFTLKFSYQVSPGSIQLPGQDPQRVLDRQSTAGLSYQL